MSTTEKKNFCIYTLKDSKDNIQRLFGVRTMRLFGSVARGDSHTESDVDICVDMDADMLKRYMLKEYLEDLLHTPVDVVRYRKNMNKVLLSDINRDGITIF